LRRKQKQVQRFATQPAAKGANGLQRAIGLTALDLADALNYESAAAPLGQLALR
jgi:hypothetical protein